MGNTTEVFEHTSFLQQIRRLEKDLLQAATWQYPAISIVVYDTALNGSKAVSLLEDSLNRQGQKVAHVTPDSSNRNTIEEEITHNRSWNETVFFVMHLSFNSDQAIYEMINARSDFLINNRLRIVFWITEEDFATFISQIPSTSLFEHRFYTLVNNINWGSIWDRIGTQTSKARTTKIKVHTPSESTSFDELLSLDIRDDFRGLLKRAHLLINYSLFYLHHEEYDRAFPFANKAVELANFIDEGSFLAKASLVRLLLQIKSGQGDPYRNLEKEIIKKIDRQSSSWVLLGKVFQSLLMFDNALAAFQNAADLDRYNPTAFQGLAEIFLQQKKYNQAIDSFQKALEYHQNSSITWQGLGKAYKAVGNYAKALEAYQCSIEIDHRQPNLFFEISKISESESALIAVQRALEIEPESVIFWNALGNMQYRMKNYNDAVRSYYRAINIEKNYGWAYANMALIHTQTSQYEKAILLLNKSLQVFQNDFDKAHIYYRLGRMYQQSGNYPDAAEAYRKARYIFDDNRYLEHYSSSPGPIHIEAAAPEDNEPNKHKISFSKPQTRSFEPKEKVSIEKILPREQKISYTNTLKKAFVSNQKARSIGYWFELGSFYIRNRMYDLAEDAYRMAIELEPENGWPYYNLGKAYMFSGLYDDAVPLYEKSIELFKRKKDQALSWNQLGNAYRRLNEHSLAVAAYERARILDTENSPMLLRARASLLSNCHAQ